MQKKHLSRDQLTAFRDGALADRRAMEHLVSCPDCQRAFDDGRWLLALARMRREVTELEHPDRDELAAYLSQALSSRRASGIARHLRTCDSCLARYGRMRQAEAASDYSSPAPALLRATQRRFRSRPKIRELGALVLARFGDVVAVLHRPTSQLASSEMTLACLDPMDEMGERFSDVPDLAEAPPLRKTNRKGLVGPPDPRKNRRAMEIRKEQKLCKIREEVPEPPEAYVVVEAGPLALIFDAGLKEGRPVLSVLAIDRESGDPQAGLVVVVESEDGEREETLTTGDRAASLPLPRGTSTLLIRARETYKLTIDFLLR